jgi:hypothetical protein
VRERERETEFLSIIECLLDVFTVLVVCLSFLVAGRNMVMLDDQAEDS